MNQPLSKANGDAQSGADMEISLVDIVHFLQGAWEKFAISAAVGVVLGLGGWFVLGSYSAEYVLLNNNNNNNNYALDLVSWKMLQKNLPNLAGQIIDENKVPDNQAAIFIAMASDQWWQKNIAPSFALTKADTKDLPGLSKDLDSASTTILNFTITASGASKQQAIENVRAASRFLRSGGAYLQLRSLFTAYETQAISAVSDIQQRITNTQIEMGYQQERIRRLEDLRKRFPEVVGSAHNTQQINDPKDSSAKYLGLQTQLIAAINDLNASKELLERLHKRLDQVALAKTFLEQALPLQGQTFDGLKLSQQLLEIESNLRSKLPKDDNNGADFLNALQSELLAIQLRFTGGLEANTAPTSSGKKGITKAIAGGLVIALFLMLQFLLAQKVWARVKVQDAKLTQ